MKSKSSLIRKIITVFLICVIAFSGYKIATIKLSESKEKARFVELKKEIDIKDEDSQNSDNLKKEKIKSRYEKIHSQNSDYIGWLKIDDTPIDYPVMYTPEDIEFYLRRDFDKKWSFSGTPFIGKGSDVQSKSFIIYSHNMKNDTMFGTLERYQDIEYKKSHPVINFETENESRKYEVIAAFSADLDKEHFDYYNQVGDWTEEQFKNYIDNISRISYYGNIENLSYNDQIVQLSTCSYFAESGRFVVVAKRIR